MINRREFLSRTAALAAALPALDVPSALAAGSYAHEHPDMLVSYFVAATNRITAEWDEKRSRMRTPAEIEARNRFVREQSIRMIGGFPQRTPLEPRIVKVIERPGYRIENLMFQSRPDFWVTGNLYVPTSGAAPRPAIISPCGHYPLARMVPQYQMAYLNFVKNGFVVLAYDPIGQGERRQYWNPETDVTQVGGPTTEHSMPGQLLILLGESLTQYHVWDGMRAIDYLLTRPEVDPARIGCAGHSGGGTLTMFIAAMDERVACAVVNEGGTQNRWPLQVAPNSPVGPSDVEQNIFPAAIHGIDHVDLHAAVAPRPLLSTIEHHSERYDSSVEKIRERYRQLGVPDKFAAVASDDPHAWTYKLRLANTDWFSRWFLGRPGPSSEPELTPERPEDLYCTPHGSVRYSHQGDTVWSKIQKTAATLPPARPAGDMRTQIRELLHLSNSTGSLSPRQVIRIPRRGLQIDKVEFLSEPGIYVSSWVFMPEKRQPDPPIVYVNEAGIAADGMEFEGSEASGIKPGPLEDLARRGHLVIAADLRGIGETRPSHPSPSSGGEFRHLFDVETGLAYMAWYIDRSLFGMRVQDLLRTVDYVLSRPDAQAREVRVIGKDMGALWALYAAALDPRITAAVCERGLISYRALTSVDRYLHGANVFVPGVLRHFDLPQVAAAAGGRRLALLSPVDAMKQPVDLNAAQEAYAGARTAGKFQVVARDPAQDLAAQYLSLLA